MTETTGEILMRGKAAYPLSNRMRSRPTLLKERATGRMDGCQEHPN